MPYGLKYTCDFDSNITSYSLQILQKDYSGSVTALTGSSSPVTHSWETDEPTPPIKGSSIAISLINEGTIPLSDLYSVDDEEFKAILIWHTGITDIVMFEGFIVQDDSSELMVDYNHEISLSASDNLGLLKDVLFDQAKYQPLILIGTFTPEYAQGADVDIISLSHTIGSILQPGDLLVITGSNIDGTYTVISVFNLTLSDYVTVKEAVIPGPSVSTATIIVYRPDMYSLRSLNSFVRSCLASTGLNLQVIEFVNLNEVSQPNTDCFFDQTYLDPQTFNDSSSWDDCYEVLTKILERFDCTLCQAKGKWHIIRFPELRDYDYSIPGFLYDADFTYLNTVELNEATTGFAGWPKFLIGIGETSVAENGLYQRIARPFRFVKETFNYRQPAELLRNSNLQQLGSLITTYTTGSGPTLKTISEYEMPWWYYTNAFPTPTGVNGPAVYFIRVILDNLGNEIERYAVVMHDAIHSFQVDANAGDYFKYSFSFKGLNNNTTGISAEIIVKLTDGTTTKIICLPGVYGDPDFTGWKVTGFGYAITIDGDTSSNWNNVEIESKPVPFDGILTFYLHSLTHDTNDETQIKDIRLDYIPLINQSTKIIGQTHTSDQRLNIKNDQERDIFIDTSPRNSIAGTLFLDSFIGLLKERCVKWNRKTRTESLNLGEITTEETLFLRRLPRTLLEGTFHGLLSPPQTVGPITIVDHISILTPCKYTYFPDLNFIFGRLEIDYRNNTASGTLYEMYKDTESDADLSYFYLFQFLYATK